MDEKMKRVSLETVEKFLTEWKSKPAETQWAVLGAIQMAMLMSKPVTEPEKQPA